MAAVATVQTSGSESGPIILPVMAGLISKPAGASLSITIRARSLLDLYVVRRDLEAGSDQELDDDLGENLRVAHVDRAGVGVEEVCQRFHCGDFASVHWVALCSSTAQHEPVPKCGSFEVRFSDGTPSKFFYWDDVPGRRLRPEQVDSKAERVPRYVIGILLSGLQATQ
jgi:hypothetical protein